MAILITETWDSRQLGLELEGASAVVEYVITGTIDHNEAYDAVFLFASPTFEGLTFKSLRINPLGGPNWTATVEYGVSVTGLQVPGQAGPLPIPPPPPPPGNEDPLTDFDGVSFSTLGETTKVHTSIETRSKISLTGGIAPDFERRIGAEGEGTDVFSGRLQFSLRRNLSSLSLRYIKTLADLTGKVNEGVYRQFADSALLFLGAEGEYQGPKGWVVTYQFDVGREDVLRNNAQAIVGELPPHHYAWYFNQKTESEGKVTEAPIAIYVERVYEYGDFDDLGI